MAEDPILNSDDGRVIPLGTDPPPAEQVHVSRPGRLHGLSIAGIAIFALIGIGALFLFVTVSWPQETSRWVLAVFFLSGVGFMVSASVAVFSAARDTYATSRRSSTERDQP